MERSWTGVGSDCFVGIRMTGTKESDGVVERVIMLIVSGCMPLRMVGKASLRLLYRTTD
jgi:hypothetical protein